MTWDEILALDEMALNLAIEEHCTSHQWRHERIPGVHDGLWVLDHTDVPGRLWASVPHLHYTATWERCMALAWQYRIGLRPFAMNTCWVVERGEEEVGIVVMTEAEARRAICQLALWQTLQETEHA